MPNKRLERIWYKTDVNDEEPEYMGRVSDVFPPENQSRKIVAVDWSERGWVEVTWLVTAPDGM